MAEAPFTEITERAHRENLLPPLFMRADAIAEIDEQCIASMDRSLLTMLASDAPIEEKTRQLFKTSDGDATQALGRLVTILENATAVDILTRLSPDTPPTAILPVVREWKQAWTTDLMDPSITPPDITSENDVIAYELCVLPVRPGQERLHKHLYTELFSSFLGAQLYGANKHRLHEPTRDAIAIVHTSAQIALDIAKHDPTKQAVVVDSIHAALRAQEPWTIAGADNLDTTSHRLITTLAEAKLPGSATVIMDTLFRRIYQDAPIAGSAMHASLSEDLGWRWGMTVKPYIDTFFDAAMALSPRETASAIGAYMHTQGIIRDVAESLAIRPDFYKTPIIPKGNQLEYFGTTFTLTQAPANTARFEHYTFGMIGAVDKNGTILALYRADPRSHPITTDAILLAPIPFNDMLFWGQRQYGPAVDAATVTQFFADLPQLKVLVGASTTDAISPEAFPLAVYFQLWQFQKAHPDLQDQLTTFCNTFGATGVFSLLSGEYSQAHLPQFIAFALGRQEPRIWQDDEMIHARFYEAFPEQLIGAYHGLATDAWEFARAVSQTEEEATALRDTLLLRAKALLFAGATLPEPESQEEQQSQEAYIILGIQYHRAMLAALMDTSGSVAAQFDIPYDTVKQMFSFYRPDNPDSRAVFHSAMELWFEKYRVLQRHAPYAGKVEEITNKFYRELWEEAQNNVAQYSNETTADTLLEIKRYTGDIREAIESGKLPEEATAEHPVRIGFLGMWTGERVENTLIEYYRSRTRGYQFYGFDIQYPDTKPEGVTYDLKNMATIGFDPQYTGAFRRLYAIWSPYMDVLEFDHMAKTTESLARALEDNGELIIDIHFPVGAHSYEQLRQDFHTENPSEPEGMMYKQFGKTGKLFFASDPQMLLWLFEQYGLECVNLPRDPEELTAMLSTISKDDSIILQGPQEDMNKQAVYQTQAGANRITYILRKTGKPKETILTRTMPTDTASEYKTPLWTMEPRVEPGYRRYKPVKPRRV